MSRQKDRVGSVRNAKVSNQEFLQYGNAAFWQSKARELYRAASVLASQFGLDWAKLLCDVEAKDAGRIAAVPYPPANITPQYIMLAAFSLENLFKALIVHSHPELLSGGQTTGILRSHDLLSLAGWADVPLSEEEHRFCVMGSSAAVYWGRYPISNVASGYVDAVAIGGQSILVFDVMFARLDEIVSDRCKTWHGQGHTA